MMIKDTNGKFELKYDASRRIVTEKAIGLFSAEDYSRLHNEYLTKLAPQLTRGGRQWAKVCDMREYKTSRVVQNVNEHAIWASTNGFSACAVVVAKVIDGMQMRETAKGTPLKVEVFTDIPSAEAWLKGLGF